MNKSPGCAKAVNSMYRTRNERVSAARRLYLPIGVPFAISAVIGSGFECSRFSFQTMRIPMWQLIKEEPVSAQGIIQAVLALGTSFGLGLSSTQMGAILAVTAVILTFLTRQQVAPLANPKTNDEKPLVSQQTLPRPMTCSSIRQLPYLYRMKQRMA
jgi:hypothetical protein